jgi:hypothetical protein
MRSPPLRDRRGLGHCADDPSPTSEGTFELSVQWSREATGPVGRVASFDTWDRPAASVQCGRRRHAVVQDLAYWAARSASQSSAGAGRDNR